MTIQRLPYESIDGMLKRLKKATANANLIADMKRHAHYEKPSVRKRKKSAAARERIRKAAEKNG